jgi:hypothetical protein
MSEAEDIQAAEKEIEQTGAKPESLEQVALDALDKKTAEGAKDEPQTQRPEKTEETAKAGEKEEEGYYADDVEDEEEATGREESLSEIRKEWQNLSPLEQYLAERIPPLTIKGTVDGRKQTLQIYDVTNIPGDFEFASRSEERAALVSLGRMERKAEQLEAEFKAEEQQKQNVEFQNKERADIRADIAALQREGEIPLGTPGTDPDTDPKLQIARDVLAYYEAENAKRLEQANRAGRLFNRLSYYDAYRLWKLDNPKVSEEQQAEDKERKAVTRRAARGQRQGATQRESKRVDLPRTASLEEVAFAALEQ